MCPLSGYPDQLLVFIDGPEEVAVVRLHHGKRYMGVELDEVDVE
ncbi:MAG: hypothetical protein ACKO14_02865 [Armatimonadota bacterium]